MPNKMRPLRCFCFVLLIWSLESVNAQNNASCEAPTLEGGYFVPRQDSYSHGSDLYYACENGRKPTMEGWWATIKCQNGEWSQKPECIDDDKCILPNIPNAYLRNSKRWYEDGERIQIQCNEGYESTQSAVCNKGTWTSVPICEQRSGACYEPPKIPHGIITQGYQELFPSNSMLSYKCEDGYGVEEGAVLQIRCDQGEWKGVQSCNLKPPETDNSRSVGGDSSPGVGHGGGTSGAGGRGNAGDNIGGGPGNSGHINSGHSNAGGGHTVGGGRGTSAGDRTQPVGGAGHGGGGVSTDSVPNPNESEPYAAIHTCGEIPSLENGDFFKTSDRLLTYKCNAFYKLEGPAQVMCYSDRTWSQLPTCKVDYCIVWRNTAGFQPLPQNIFLKEGQHMHFLCLTRGFYGGAIYSQIICENTGPRFLQCCPGYESWC